jgi:hypothetical protein
MATDQVGESRDVGTLLHEERQVLDVIAIGMPVAALFDARCWSSRQRSAVLP